ncbi:glycosyltransferase [Bartonella tamiae]
MAVYNKAHVIKCAIDSILNQQTDYSFIVIVIDDCSTDGSQFIVKEY